LEVLLFCQVLREAFQPNSNRGVFMVEWGLALFSITLPSKDNPSNEHPS
jgi:hypothetical protein